ncbi:MAG: helix-turn-helix domain-containing protein [Pseudomonadota bacterium]
MSSTNESSIFRFSTRDFRPSERLEAWQELFGRKVAGIDVEPLSDEPFLIETSVKKLPGLTLLAKTQTPMRMARTRTLLTDGNDGLVLFIPRTTWCAHQFAREFTLEAGDAALLSLAEIGASVTPSVSSVAVQILPRETLLPRLRTKSATPFGHIRRNNEALRLLRRYVSHLWRQPLADAELRAAAVGHVYDLVAVALGANRDAAEMAKKGGLAAGRLQAAKDYVLAHLSRANLTLDDVAKQQGITPRYLRMLFETEGETFSQFVREQRLQRVYGLLMNPRHAGSAISAIAYESGFSDLSYFNRAFRLRYDATPSDVRAQSKG